MVVDRVETIASDKANRVRQDGARDRIGRRNADAWNHGLLGRLADHTWVHLYPVGMLVQMLQISRDFGIWVEVLKCLVWLKSKELSELIESCEAPFA